MVSLLRYIHDIFSCYFFNFVTGISYHEEICVPVDDKISKVTSCPKDYLDIENPSLSFDPKKEECSYIYDQIKTRILRDCIKVNDSQKCEIDPLTDISSQPECFQLYEFRILHTCEGEQTSKVYISTTIMKYENQAVDI